MCNCVYEGMGVSVCAFFFGRGGGGGGGRYQRGEWHMAYSLAPVTHMSTPHTQTNMASQMNEHGSQSSPV